MTVATLILTALVIEFLEGILVRLIIALTVAPNVDSKVDGLTEGVLVSQSLASYVIGCTMVGRSADDGQTCGEVDAIVHSQHLEGSQPLVVVHSQDGIVMLVGSTAKEAVGREGAIGVDMFSIGLVNGRLDNLLLFLTQ